MNKRTELAQSIASYATMPSDEAIERIAQRLELSRHIVAAAIYCQIAERRVDELANEMERVAR